MTVLELRVVKALAMMKEPTKDTSASAERLGFLPTSPEDIVFHARKVSDQSENPCNLIYHLSL
jgi:hypothetical protein